MSSSLVDAVLNSPLTSVLQHGYAHRNHAAPGKLKLELGGEREPESIHNDLRHGFELMQSRFDESFCPVLVPPWNRIDTRILDQLAGYGIGPLVTDVATPLAETPTTKCMAFATRRHASL